MEYQHLTIEEREKIQEMLWQKSSTRSIAKTIGRSPSSVSREIQRNKPPERYRYTPRLAHERALRKRKCRGRAERLKNNRIRSYVVLKLKLRWSPEQISGRIVTEKEHISHEAIYQFVYAQVHRDGWGDIRFGCEDLRPYLRWKRKRRLKKGTRRCQRIFKPLGTPISERPLIVERRIRIGDWEGDTVESRNHKPGINTLVERKTGLVFITKLDDRTSISTTQVVVKRFTVLPLKMRRTLTLDRGPENSCWQTLERITATKCFFANAYHSWERGTNENTNGLIRDYFPKKTDFTTIPDEIIAEVEYLLNTRPRKRLGWRTPLEVMSVALRG